MALTFERVNSPRFMGVMVLRMCSVFIRRRRMSMVMMMSPPPDKMRYPQQPRNEENCRQKGLKYKCR